MKRLVPKDGTTKHIRTARFTERTTRRHKATKAIGESLAPLREDLKKKVAEANDAMEAQTDATADAQLVDAEAGDVIRTLHDEATILDRKDVALGLEPALFPDGLPAVVARTGAAQAKAIDELVQRFEALRERAPALAESTVPQLVAMATAVREAEKAQQAAFARTGAAQGLVRLAKARIREELEAVYGALRMLFKSNPKQAERYFPSASTTRDISRDVDSDEPVADEDERPAA